MVINFNSFLDGPEEKSESSLETLITKVRELGVDPSLTAPSYFFCPIMQVSYF